MNIKKTSTIFCIFTVFSMSTAFAGARLSHVYSLDLAYDKTGDHAVIFEDSTTEVALNNGEAPSKAEVDKYRTDAFEFKYGDHIETITIGETAVQRDGDCFEIVDIQEAHKDLGGYIVEDKQIPGKHCDHIDF